MTVTEEHDPPLSRAQNRLLRRIYNGRSVPIVADGRPFLTYKDASRYLRSLAPQARDAVYAAMKEQANSPSPDGPDELHGGEGSAGNAAMEV